MCGIIGVSNQTNRAISDIYTGLLAMQHRGKESAGVAVYDGGKITEESGLGELPQAFWLNSIVRGLREIIIEEKEKASDILRSLVPKSLNEMNGRVGIGHVRYATTGRSNMKNCQPIKGTFRKKDFYVAHNGNLVNTAHLKNRSKSPDDASDTKVIADLISQSKRRYFPDAVLDVLHLLQGAFNLIFLHRGILYAATDPFGFHPLQIGTRDADIIIASESCVFDNLEAKLLFDIPPGKLISVNNGKDAGEINQESWTDNISHKKDIFEFIYFLRPDSKVCGVRAKRARFWMGWKLAEEHPIDADIIVPVPDSGKAAAWGYYQGRIAQDAMVEYKEDALFRPHTVSRTFIEPVQSMRKKYLHLKFNPCEEDIRGKRIVLVDDSVVRGNTIEVLATMLHKAGAKEIHVLASSPPYVHPDFYGIDTYRVKDELLVKRQNIEGSIREAENRYRLASLGYLSLSGTITAVLRAGRESDSKELSYHDFYDGPFTGNYPAGTGDFKID